ncbi:helix-turn-helix domain-containing protein [Gordonia pseudamarae]|jgi:transcriptional regulator with XRE-family HTH domain|uniref:Helix-turn-helix domain-containing protein n=1 Tax=Gordonia pseudamarae TaxID=2831662 RepID=A0ABX6IFD6_9ACTN|nr:MULTISPECIES: helix-turn-helix transcriptional regulator [Gordonia]MBD0020545.1 helix-turn-helix transcriptional regulator [Gordonia sp. (in: high G+C Gram-positive bacteria)]QHN25621.1 helix-turn-helix domain-containing protein [Gordonia pseudamarae]QHN34554.1 helix-turn-helix domain-containing protein [Gordonia pseudamarae]
MADWFKATPESERLLSEERLILEATETVYEALERSGTTKTNLASRLGVTKSEIGQRLSGRRNLTIRSFAAMLHELGLEAKIVTRPLTRHDEIPNDDITARRRQQVPVPDAVTYRTSPVRLVSTSTSPEAVAG